MDTAQKAWLPYAEALAIVSEASPLTPTSMTPAEAGGYVCAEDVRSRVAVPSFPNSAMDGFAVRAADCSPLPCSLPVIGQSVAGDRPERGGPAAWEIMTGAPVPDSYDTIIMIENVQIETQDADGNPLQIKITEPPEKGRHIRMAGEDFNSGDLLVSKGTKITAAHIMALAAVGTETISVAPCPRVTLISTGAEIIDDPQQVLRPGQIYNSNAPYLASQLKDLGATPSYAGVIPDIPEEYEACLTNAMETSDVIISTGAVSAGRFDFVPSSLKKLGADIVFHKVAIRPGKPILYARLPNGTHYLGLPGNPISAAVGLRFFGVPLLRALTGQPPETGLRIPLAQPFSKPHALRFFTKAKLNWASSGPVVEVLSGQQSFKIHPMLEANCWAVLEEERRSLPAGGSITVFPMLPDQWTFA